jgi:MFS transporter, DHA1 family, inner membrane transport protein
MGKRREFDKNSQKGLFTISLAYPFFAITLSNLILNILLLEVASTFQINPGVAVQLRTINSLAEIIFSLLIGLLSARFKHKSLLLVGICLVIISAVGNFLASSFSTMMFFFFLEGIGSIVITVMAYTLAGNLLDLKKRPKVISWMTATGFIAVFIGTLAINYIVIFASWHSTFMLLVLPSSIIALILAFTGIPNLQSAPVQNKILKKTNFGVYKEILLNKSAVRCLLGNLFSTGVAGVIFILTFLRQQFSASLDIVVYVNIIATIIIIFGSLSAGQIMSRFGVKSPTVVGSIISGSLTLLLFFSPTFWISSICYFSAVWFAGLTLSSSTCLILNQVPEHRDVLMSLSRFFVALSGFIVPAIGGFLLVLFSIPSVLIGYQSIGIMLCVMNILAGILYSLAKVTYNNKSAELIDIVHN